MSWWIPPFRPPPPPSPPPGPPGIDHDAYPKALDEWEAGQSNETTAPTVVFRLGGEVVGKMDAGGSWERVLPARTKRKLMQEVKVQQDAQVAEVVLMKKQLKAANAQAAIIRSQCDIELKDMADKKLRRDHENSSAYRKLNKTKGELADVCEALDDTRGALKVSNLKVHDAEKRAAAATRKLLLRERQYGQEREEAAAAAAAAASSAAAATAASDVAATEMRVQLVEVREAYAALQELQSTIEVERAAAEVKAQAAVDSLKEVVGVDIDRSLPARKFEGDPSRPTAKSAWGKRVSKHVTAVLKGRLDDDDGVRNIARSLQTAGGKEIAEKLLATPEFAAAQKPIVKETLNKVAEHWTARLSVHVWDRLHHSERSMETLRHLLSFTYDRPSNNYMPIKIWENPHDESDFLVMAQLAGRRARHADFNAIAGTCGIVVGADGHCQRDTVELINTMYSRYKGAMRSNFSTSRPSAAGPLPRCNGSKSWARCDACGGGQRGL